MNKILKKDLKNASLENLNGNISINIDGNAVSNDLSPQRDSYKGFRNRAIVLTVLHAYIQANIVGISWIEDDYKKCDILEKLM